MDLDKKDLELIRLIRDVVIERQRSGKPVPGHTRVCVGLFENCSGACERDNCLSVRARNLRAKSEEELRMHQTEEDIETISALCDFIRASEKSQRTSEMVGCLQTKLGKLPKPQNEGEMEKLVASRVCAATSDNDPEKDFLAHFEGCEWCKEYVRQRQEAKKYITYNEVERPSVAGDDSDRC